MVFSVSDICIQHDQLLWCFQYQAYVYSMISYNGVFSIRRMYTAWSVIMVFQYQTYVYSIISYYGVFSIRRMYTAWSVIMVFSASDVYIKHDQLLWCFQYQTYVYSMISYYGVFSIRRILVYSMISYYGVFSIRRMYTAWSVIMAFSVSDVCIQHNQLLWCFQYQTYVYSMISYYGVFSIRRMYTTWSVIMVFSASDVCIQHDQLLWWFQWAYSTGTFRVAPRDSAAQFAIRLVKEFIQPKWRQPVLSACCFVNNMHIICCFVNNMHIICIDFIQYI